MTGDAMRDVIELPTEEMLDAARPLFIYFLASPSKRWTLGQHMEAGGWSTAGLTPEQLAYAGIFPKAERAAMVWNMMLSAAPASARLALARAITPDTHAVVPVEATRAMLAEAYSAAKKHFSHEARNAARYRAMIAAARGAEGGK